MSKILYLLHSIVFITGCSIFTSAQIITTYAGNGTTGYSGNGGPATGAYFNSITSLATDKNGDLYIDDQSNNCVRKVFRSSGIVITSAGNGYLGYNGDNQPATAAEMKKNWGIALDKTGNLFIADQDNYCIRKVDTFGYITRVAGDTSSGNSGDGGPATAARFVTPFGIAVDGSGNIFVGDQDMHIIRKINNSGIINTIAGVTGISGGGGDGGPATLATLSVTFGISVDTSGNLFICDRDNNRIRKISTGGIITTIAGNGTAGYFGDGGPATAAEIFYPIGVFPDRNGNVYIADCYNNRIRMVDPTGHINTIAGTGTAGFGGDGGLATAAELNHPSGVTVDDSDNIFIADYYNERVRKIKKIKLLTFTGGHSQYITVCENAHFSIDSVMSVIDYYTGFTDTWHVVTEPTHGYINVNYTYISTGGIIVPTGLTYIPDTGYVGRDTFRVRVTDGVLADTTAIFVAIKTIYPPAGAISGDSLDCPGSAILLTESLNNGQWSTGISGIISPNDSACLLTGLEAGNDTIGYAVSNGCGTTVASKIIIVYPLPDTGIITGPGTLCIGDSVVIVDSVAGGIWSENSTWAQLHIFDSAATIKSSVAGLDTILYTVKNAFCTASASKILNVNPLPFVDSLAGDNQVCVHGIGVMTDSVTGGTWRSWNGNATVTPGTDSGSCNIAGILPGPDTIFYTVNFFCGIATASKAITIDSLPQAPVISEKEYTLWVPPGYASYQWTLDGAAIPGAVQDTFLVSIAGTYAVTVGNQEGCTISSLPVNCPDCSPDEISVFPNPSPGFVNIQWCRKVIVKIMCMDGKIFEITSGVNSIDLGELPDGTYLLAIFDEFGKKIKTATITKAVKD